MALTLEDYIKFYHQRLDEITNEALKQTNLSKRQVLPEIETNLKPKIQEKVKQNQLFVLDIYNYHPEELIQSTELTPLPLVSTRVNMPDLIPAPDKSRLKKAITSFTALWNDKAFEQARKNIDKDIEKLKTAEEKAKLLNLDIKYTGTKVGTSGALLNGILNGMVSYFLFVPEFKQKYLELNDYYLNKRFQPLDEKERFLLYNVGIPAGEIISFLSVLYLTKGLGSVTSTRALNLLSKTGLAAKYPQAVIRLSNAIGQAAQWTAIGTAPTFLQETINLIKKGKFDAGKIAKEAGIQAVTGFGFAMADEFMPLIPKVGKIPIIGSFLQRIPKEAGQSAVMALQAVLEGHPEQAVGYAAGNILYSAVMHTAGGILNYPATLKNTLTGRKMKKEEVTQLAGAVIEWAKTKEATQIIKNPEKAVVLPSEISDTLVAIHNALNRTDKKTIMEITAKEWGLTQKKLLKAPDKEINAVKENVRKVIEKHIPRINFHTKEAHNNINILMREFLVNNGITDDNKIVNFVRNVNSKVLNELSSRKISPEEAERLYPEIFSKIFTEEFNKLPIKPKKHPEEVKVIKEGKVPKRPSFLHTQPTEEEFNKILQNTVNLYKIENTTGGIGEFFGSFYIKLPEKAKVIGTSTGIDLTKYKNLKEPEKLLGYISGDKVSDKPLVPTFMYEYLYTRPKKGEKLEPHKILKNIYGFTIYKHNNDYYVYNTAHQYYIKSHYKDAVKYIDMVTGDLVYKSPQTGEIVGIVQRLNNSFYIDEIMKVRQQVEGLKTEMSISELYNEIKKILKTEDKDEIIGYLYDSITQNWTVDTLVLFNDLSKLYPDAYKKMKIALRNGVILNGDDFRKLLYDIGSYLDKKNFIKGEIGVGKVINTQDGIHSTIKAEKESLKDIEGAEELDKAATKISESKNGNFIKNMLSKDKLNKDEANALFDKLRYSYYKDAFKDKNGILYTTFSKKEHSALKTPTFLYFKQLEDGSWIKITEKELPKTFEVVSPRYNLLQSIDNIFTRKNSDQLSVTSDFKNVYEFVDWIAEKFGVVIKKGRIGRPEAVGVTKGGVIRLKHLTDLETLFHEIGHRAAISYKNLSNVINNNSIIRDELNRYFQENVSPEMIKKYAKLGTSVEEGFAMFFKDYILGKVNFEKYPIISTYWINWLNNNSEVNNVIENIRKYVLSVQSSSPAEQARQYIMSSDIRNFKQRPSENLRTFINNFFDDHYGLKYLTDLAQRYGVKVAFEENPYYLSMIPLQGVTESMLRWGIEDPLLEGKRISKSFAEILKSIEKLPSKVKVDNQTKFNDVSVYLISLRTQVAKQKGRSIHSYFDENYEKIIKELETKYDATKLREIAKDINQFNSALWYYANKKGLISDALYNQAKEIWDFYVPVYRFFDRALAENPNLKYMRKLLQLGIKEQVGSEEMFLDPIQGILRNFYTFMTADHNQRVLRSVIKLVDSDKTGELSKIIEEIPPAGRIEKISGSSGIRSFLKNVRELFSRHGKKLSKEEEAEIKRIFSEVEKSIWHSINIDFQNKILKVVDYNNKERPIRWFQFHDDEIFKALTLTSFEEGLWLESILRFPTKVVRAGAVEFSPYFFVKNIFRDSFTKSIYTRTGIPVPILNTISSLPKTLFHILKEDELYRQATKYGVRYATLSGYDIYMDLMKKDKGKIINTLRKYNPLSAYLKFFQSLSSYSELLNRLPEMEQALKKGKSYMEAAFLAREVTQDFSRMGKQIRVLNKYTAFLGANVGAWYKLYREMKERPLTITLRCLLNITLPSIVLHYINKNNSDVQNQSEFIKAAFWIVPIPRKNKSPYLLKIPKPFELGFLFGTVPEIILDTIEGRRPTKESLIEMMGYGISWNFIPNFARLGLTIYANYDFFRGRPITPKWMETLLPEYQRTERTSILASNLGKLLGISPQLIDTLKGEIGLNSFDGLFNLLDIMYLYGSGKKEKAKYYFDLLKEDTWRKTFGVIEPMGFFSAPVIHFYREYENVMSYYNTYNSRSITPEERKKLEGTIEKKFKGNLNYYASKFQRTYTSLRDIHEKLNKITTELRKEDLSENYIEQLVKEGYNLQKEMVRKTVPLLNEYYKDVYGIKQNLYIEPKD